MAITRDEVGQLADIAKIWMSDVEKEEMTRDMELLFAYADTLYNAAPAGGAGDITGAGGTAVSADMAINAISPQKNLVVTISELREDAPVHDIETEVFYELSPSGGGGFTIPRLLE